jgi:hypothetical protein
MYTNKVDDFEHTPDTPNTPGLAKTPDSRDLKFYIFMFIQEFIEIFIILFIYKLITNSSKVELVKSIKVGGIIAVLSTILEYYNPKLKGHIKSGLFSGLGSSVIG